MPKLFNKHTNDQQADSLADYLPGGKLFQAKKIPGTKLRSLLKGLSYILMEAEEFLSLMVTEYDIQTTTLFIEEWEDFVGIPDDCFDRSGTLEERRRNVLVKLTSLGAQTTEDFIALAELFDVTVEVLHGVEHTTFPLTFPWLFTATVKQARFTMIIKFISDSPPVFPLTFPFTFGDPNSGIIECLFKKIKPANVNIIFYYGA